LPLFAYIFYDSNDNLRPGDCFRPIKGIYNGVFAFFVHYRPWQKAAT